MPTIVIRPQAVRDLTMQARYIARTRPKVAVRLFTAAARTMSRLAGAPLMAAAWESENPGLRRLRFSPIRGFRNHLIFYLPLKDGIDVVRVIRGTRDLQSLLEDM